MDNVLLIVSLLLTLLFIALTTYWFFLRPSTRIGPVIYLVGPSGSGKTALWTYFKYGTMVPTQTSMAINSATVKNGSLDRSVTIIDCPGHPRLAHLLRQSLSTTKPKGIILMIDAATLNKELNDVSNTVYSTLLALPRPAYVLCVANKSDLFTALPVGRVRELLEKEITSLKKTRDDISDEDERTTLGGTEFKFSELEEEAVFVEWGSGSVESRQVAGILEWISRRISR